MNLLPLGANSCADPGIFARRDPGPTALFFFCFFLVLNLFYSFTVVYQWFISKKTDFPRFQRSNIFQGGPIISGLPRSGKNFWKMKNFSGQGKVKELHFQSGKFKKKMKKVMEKSGNFTIFLKRR